MLWSKIRGTLESKFQLGFGGPILKNASGVVESRNPTDLGYVITRAADPIDPNDLVTLNYFNTFVGTAAATADSLRVLKAGDTMSGNLRVDAAVGIGAAPTEEVDVTAGVGATAAVRVRGNGEAGGVQGMDLFANTTGHGIWGYGARNVVFGAGGAARLYVFPNTSGIGIATSGTDQFVGGTGTNASIGMVAGSVYVATASSGACFVMRGNTYSTNPNQRGNMYFVAGDPAAPGATEGAIHFYTGATLVRASIDRTGNMGIGTTGPTALLHVAGMVKVNDNLIVPKTAGKGIQVDPAAPTFPWHDILGCITVRGIGANDPDWAVFRDTIRQYRWANGSMREAWNTYHIPHDYVPGTDLHIHVHWEQNVVDTGGPAGVPGNVKWYFDMSYAKGHGTPGGAADPFNAIITTSVVQQASTTQYGHMIAEVQITNVGGDASHIDVARIEPDGLLKTRFYRDSGDAEDTLDQDPFVGFVDLHYQTSNLGTKQKSPNFYV